MSSKFGTTEIICCPHLEGSKVAIQFGHGPIHVSPAMWNLLTHATPSELETLLKAIMVRRLPELPSISMFACIPLTTQSPEWPA